MRRGGERSQSVYACTGKRPMTASQERKKVDRREKENRNTRVGIGNALRTDIAPSNVAYVGPGGQGGSSASARQAATAIRFAHMGHVNDAPDWRLPPPEGTEGREPRAQHSSAQLAAALGAATTLNMRDILLFCPREPPLTRVCTPRLLMHAWHGSYLVQTELHSAAFPSSTKRPSSAILCSSVIQLSCSRAA